MFKYRNTVRGAIPSADIEAAYRKAFGMSEGGIWQRLLQLLFGGTSVFQFADASYKEVNEGQINMILQADATDKETYEAEGFDCDDFAFMLMGVFHQNTDTAAMPIFITWVSMTEGGHAVLSYYKDGEVKIIEPQNDEIYDVPKEWGLMLLCG